MLTKMAVFLKITNAGFTKLNMTCTVIILIYCSNFWTSIVASSDSIYDSSNDRTTRSNKDIPDPNIALEGQCVVVCDAKVVGLKQASDDPKPLKTNRVELDSTGDDNISDPPTNFWDKISGPVCDGLVNVGRRSRKVAFSAKRSIDLTAPDTAMNGKTTVTFDHVLVNIGNGFNMESSTFVAPVSGVYSLYFQVYRLYNKNPLTIDLHVNGIPVLRGFADGESANHNSAHNSGMIHLVALDRVDVKVSGGNLDSGWKYSTFSGYLVFEDENF
uniref:cerebellin-1-like n=1 Tax=Styela clava TaxID=7725 RepID=UPI00193A3F95|nr:cerebellin-1-like [Styela clava]